MKEFILELPIVHDIIPLSLQGNTVYLSGLCIDVDAEPITCSLKEPIT